MRPQYTAAGALATNAAGEVTFTVPPVAIETDAGSVLQYIHTDNITQHSELYTVVAKYELRFQPYSIVRAVNGNGATLKLTLSYPK